MAAFDDVIGVEVDCLLRAGRQLVAKDGGGVFGKAKTSDPFVVVSFGQHTLGTSHVVPKNLSPQWNQTFKWNIEGRAFHNAKGSRDVVFSVFDFDKFSKNDPMGEVRIPLVSLYDGQVLDKWHAVNIVKGCKNASGELSIKICAALRRVLSLKRGASHPLSGVDETEIAVGLGWDMIKGNKAVDLDASCVCVSFRCLLPHGTTARRTLGPAV